jgi:hypothetical protein
MNILIPLFIFVLYSLAKRLQIKRRFLAGASFSEKCLAKSSYLITNGATIDTIKSKIENVSWISLVVVTNNNICLLTNMTWKSFGEKMTIKLEGDTLVIVSQLANKTVLDYGKNKQNIDKLYNIITS